MKLSINRNVVYVIVVVFGIIFGAGVFFLLKNFEEIRSDFEGLLGVSPSPEEVDYDKAPYFTYGFNDAFEGAGSDWIFKVFQPKIVEYYSKDGVNYMGVEYVPDRGKKKPIRLEVLLTQDSVLTFRPEDRKRLEEEGWVFGEPVDDSHPDSSTPIYIPPKLNYFDTYPTSEDEKVERLFLDIDQIKEKFKVGDRIAMQLPYSYPGGDIRTEIYCAKDDLEANLCRYGNIVDAQGVDLKKLLDGDVMEEGIVIYPKSISSGIVFAEKD